MNGYEINAAVKMAMAARRKLWLAGMEVGAEVGVQNYEGDTTAVVSRITATQLILSSGQRVNRDNGLIRGAGGSGIYELGADRCGAIQSMEVDLFYLRRHWEHARRCAHLHAPLA